MRDFATIQAYTEDDWIKFFKRDLRDNTRLFFYIKCILERGEQFEEHKVFAREAAKALKKIAAENKMNELRLADFKEDIERLAESSD